MARREGVESLPRKPVPGGRLVGIVRTVLIVLGVLGVLAVLCIGGFLFFMQRAFGPRGTNLTEVGRNFGISFPKGTKLEEGYYNASVSVHGEEHTILVRCTMDRKSVRPFVERALAAMSDGKVRPVGGFYSQADWEERLFDGEGVEEWWKPGEMKRTYGGEFMDYDDYMAIQADDGRSERAVVYLLLLEN